MSKKDIFNQAGPVHLTTVDWTNSCDRRSVAASLVKSVYVLEGDRDKNRHGSKALAPPWWKAFNFELQNPVIDDAHSPIFGGAISSHSSIFGAIYKLSYTPASSSSPSSLSSDAPRCVVAFRGTIPRLWRDLKLDLSILQNKLNAEIPSVAKAIEAVRGAVKEFGSDSVAKPELTLTVCSPSCRVSH